MTEMNLIPLTLRVYWKTSIIIMMAALPCANTLMQQLREVVLDENGAV